jgi:hypothetical protein
MPRRKGTPRTFNSRPLRPGEALDALTCTPLRLGMSACDSRHCTTATNRRGGPRKAQERPSPPSLPLLLENGARKQTLRFAVCEPWSVCDSSVSFLSATICL